MAELLDELTASGFEIVKDESGQDLVKLVFMDENDEATGYALVSPVDAKRILSGQATLQNVVDEEGKQVLTLAPVENDDVQSTSTEPITGDASIEPHDLAPSSQRPDPTDSSKPKSLDTPFMHPMDNETTEDVPNPSENSNATTGAMAKEAHSADAGLDVEQFVLSEETAVVDGKPAQVVTLMDSHGRILDHKQGSTGEQVILEMHGQMFSYELQGPSGSGEPITSTLIMSSGDPLTDDAGTVAAEPDAVDLPVTSAAWAETPSLADSARSAEDLPTGQQFTLTEASTMVDGETLQTVILTDEQGNVLDQKQGRAGDHVIIEMSGNSLEYVFLGPTENGEPITTTLMVSSEPDVSESDPATTAVHGSSVGTSESIVTASTWCPVGLPVEFYSVLCRQVEQLVTNRIPRTADGSPAYRPEPYHRKLGSLTAYQEMADLFNSYRLGARNGETLTQYENLRNFAKIYRPSGPQSRALTKYEIAMNEAAAQICRYQPGLLFHKRELFHMAKEVVEKSQTFITNERRQSAEQFSQHQPTTTHSVQHSLPPRPQPGHTQPPQPSQQQQPQQPVLPPTAVVSGRVASSQLAMLESRGLTGIIQSPSNTGMPNLSTLPISRATDLPSEKPPYVSQTLTPGSAFSSNDALARTRSSFTESSTVSPGIPLAKRDTFNRLTPSQEDALRTAALNIILELPFFDLKPKVECTNIELACWEQAKMMASQTPYPGSIETVSSFLTNEKRLTSVREASALYGRTPGAQYLPAQSVLSAPVSTSLIPYEMACNEAATYLTSAVPQLLTHRRELSEIAKKVVRNSGCLFTNTTCLDKMPVNTGAYKFYCPEQLPELDLSAADQLLTDPQDRSESPDSGCCLSPINMESEGVTRHLQTLALSCEECNNVVDDVAIYAATGTDSLKKVRILNLSGCAFTGIMPVHLNQCSNLIELNLSGNALSAFPCCLHLPKLKRLNLRNNPGLLRMAQAKSAAELPLIEQFPRLVSVELDPPLANLLSRQALVCLCPYLKFINGEEFAEEPSDETVKVLQSAKHQLSSLVYSKWEDDIAGFYKKGLPKRDAIRVIETLVMHAVKRSVDIGEPFSQCKNVLARRVAEDFLSPKMLDDEIEDDTSEKMQHLEEASDDDDTDSEAEDDVRSPTSNIPDDQTGVGIERDGNRKAKTASKHRPKKNTATEASVAEREAQAAAANLALLPDEPSDRLINVVGQALRHGKTVVYAVIRTAARQPDGELIPVGGGLGITSSTSTNANRLSPVPVDLDVPLESQPEDQVSAVHESVPISELKRQPKQQTGKGMRKSGPHKTTQLSSETPNLPVTQHSRRPGLLTRGGPVQQSEASGLNMPNSTPSSISPALVATRPSGKATPSKLRSPVSITQSTASGESEIVTSTGVSGSQSEPVVYTIHQRRLLPSDYIIKPARSESQPAYVVPHTALQNTPKPVRIPGRRGRPPSAQTILRRLAAAAQAAESPQSTPVLLPHSRPPSTMRMSTRDSNRMKRFSAYGVIDATMSNPDSEDTLPVDMEESKQDVVPEPPPQPQTEKLHAEPVEAVDDILDDVVAKAREDNMVVLLDVSESDWTSSAAVEDTSEKPSTPPPETPPKTAPRTRKRRAEQPSLSTSKGTTSPPSGSSTPITKRSKGNSPRIPDLRRQATVTSTPVSRALDESSHASVHSLSQLGSVVDYDPLHFIRCHARDNDPLDCKTKVWRCAFEPSLENSSETSTIVATCGGECVCLIDCRSGRVMKRFKHLNEEFYSLAWTTVEMAVGHRTNLLAAAGKLREIRLLHPEQLVCYAEMRGHKDDIACMIFHPEKPTVLFSGDSKGMILVWDIGIPSAPEYRTRHQLLMKLSCPRPNLNPVLNLIFLPTFESLIAGCEDGVFSWTFTEYRKEKLNEEKQPDVELKIPTRHEPCFDGLAKLTDQLIVVKCVEEGELYVLDYAQVVNRSKRLTANKKLVSVDIRGQLRWQNTDEIYINVTARSNLHTVICGDNEGTIWLYDLQKPIEEDLRKFKVKPIKILEWPECSVGGTKDEDAQMKESITSGFKNPVVNATDISHDGQYLVAVTDNNLVCIWKFSG